MERRICNLIIILSVIFSVKKSLSAPSSESISSEKDSLNEEKVIMSGLFEKDEDQGYPGALVPKPKARPPKFMQFLLNKLENMDRLSSPESNPVALTFQGKTYSKPRNKLFHAWLPTEITENQVVNRTIVTFQQSQSLREFGEFTSCQITLTLRDDVDDDDLSQTFLNIHTHWENDTLQREEVQSQQVKKNKKFYSFGITKFITSSLQEKLKRPNLIKLSFQVYADPNKRQPLDFKRFFDVHVDMPLIVMLYGAFAPRKHSSTKSGRRDRRNVENVTTRGGGERSSDMCRRHELEIDVARISWSTVVYPPTIDIGYCGGTCPFPLQNSIYNYTLHSFLLDSYKLQKVFDIPYNFPEKASCIPITYRSQSIVEERRPDAFDAAEVHNMVVESCGCRW